MDEEEWAAMQAECSLPISRIRFITSYQWDWLLQKDRSPARSHGIMILSKHPTPDQHHV